MRKVMLRLHRWLSLPFGVVLLVMCLTGALLSFERELTPQTSSPALAKPLQEQTVHPYSKPSGKRTTENFIERHHSKKDLNKGHHPNNEAKEGRHGKRPQRSPFFLSVFKLHRWLMIDSPREVSFSWGRAITGTSTIAFIVILVTGFWLWFPIVKNRGFLGSLRIRTGKGNYPLLFSLHLTSGVITAIFLLTMAVSGLYWTFSVGGLDKGLIFGLHTGRWGGMPMRIIYFVSAINGAFLVISGYWLWWKKRTMRKNAKQKNQ